MQPICGFGPRDTKRTQTGPIGSTDTIYGQKKRTKYDKKLAHRLPEWTLCIDGDTGPRWRPSQNRRQLLTCFGPRLVWAEIVSFGPAEAQCRRKTCTPGRRRTPKMTIWGPKTILRGSFIFPGILVLVGAYFGASCRPVRSGSVLSHLGPWRRIAADNAPSRAKMDPEGDCLGSQDPSRGLRNPSRELHYFRSSGAGCWG